MANAVQKALAKSNFDLALSENKLGSYIIGLPPYSEYSINEAGIRQPTPEPNIEYAYYYYTENKATDLPQAIEKDLHALIQERGNNSYFIYFALNAINAILSYEKRGLASFNIDCRGLLQAISTKVKKNKEQFQKPNEDFVQGIWPSVEFYDKSFEENYGQGFLK